MKTNILKTLSNNLGFKILALFFAFTLWLMVYNLEDPTKTKTMIINVGIENREAIENMGKYFEIIEGTNKVSFSVTAARSVLDKLDESDFVATADMEKIAVDEEKAVGTIPIEIECLANLNENTVKLSSTSKHLKVLLEDLMTKQFVVSANTTGEVAEGYALGHVEVTAPNVLKVSGPKSIVQKIASVAATIDVGGMYDSWTTYKVAPTLYDKNGKEIDTTRLTLSNSTVNVSAEILNVKEVAIAVRPSGTPASGYMITSISSNPTTIALKGNKAILNSINSIEIPESLISVAGKTEDVIVTIDVSEYIPKEVSMVNAEDAIVEITVSIGKIKEKVFSVDASNIMITGQSTHTKVELGVTNVAVHVSGLEEDIAKLSSDKLSGSIDVTYLPVGIHEVELLMDLDETLYEYQPVKVTVYITQEMGTEEPPVDSEQGGEENE